ncbi:hypothetical protein LY76DRAFT_54070 [Colletotrichum caudatum]|nr:hypothetical protein LY76DRAFT_54070 [Colletotrichum caudatum]
MRRWCGLLLKHLASSVNPTTGHTDHPSRISQAQVVVCSSRDFQPLMSTVTYTDCESLLYAQRVTSYISSNINTTRGVFMSCFHGLHQYMRCPVQVCKSHPLSSGSHGLCCNALSQALAACGYI